MFAKTALVALLAGIAAAVHAPVGNPSGNPISKPGLGELVPKGKAYTITWQPTTTNTISILLLRGPSENVVPLGAPLAEGIANTGTFVWTPATSLTSDTSRYGLQIIDDVNGQYQYSTQFGISGDNVASSSTPGGGYGYTSSAVASSSSKAAVSSAAANSTTVITRTITATSSLVLSTGSPVTNSSLIVQPTASPTVPSSLQTSATRTAATTGPAQATGAASNLRAGLGLLGAVAGVAFML